MKILQVNTVHKIGSTGKIVYDLHTYYKNKSFESKIIFGRGQKEKQKAYKAAPEWLLKLNALRSRVSGYNYAGCFFSTSKIIKIIKKINPEIVHLHCINGFFVNIYRLLNYLKKNKYNTVLTLHAEFMYTAGCGHSYECNQWVEGCCKDTKVCPQFNKQRPKSWFFNRCNKEWNLMRKAFEGFENLIICPVSDWLKHRAMQSPFMKDKKMITVMNGLDTSVFFYNYDATTALREKHGLTNEKIILHVTPNYLSDIKGGRYVTQLAESFLDDNVKFILIGRNTAVANHLKNVIALEHTNNQLELAAYYSLADITLLTSKKETFSMICAESLCCGTPIVGFEAGAPETISIKEYSAFKPYADMQQLATKVKDFLQKSWDKESISKKAIKLYDKNTMADNYLKVYSILNDGHIK